MRAWWYSLAPRERQALTVGVIGAGLLLFYFLAWEPPRQAASDLHARITETRADLAWMQRAAPRLKAAVEGDGAPDTGQPTTERALYALADETARAAGLGEALTDIQPGGERRVRVNLQGAVFDDMIRWLATLRNQHGLVVDTASIRRGDAAGRVNAQLVLSGGDAS